MAKKKYLDMLDGVEIYKQSRSHTESRIAAEVTNKLGQASGIATLDSNGKVPTSQIPGTVDEIKEGYLNPANGKFYRNRNGSEGSYTYSDEIAGETDKIYVDLAYNLTYRWGGSAFAEISKSLGLGNGHENAYYGDFGKVAYDHATETGRLTTAKSEKLYKVSVTAEGHVGSATEVTKGDLTGKGVEDASNKVSAWSSPTTDTNYPSEKLVKDSLDEKVDKVSGTAGHLVRFGANRAISDSGIPATDVIKRLVAGAELATANPVSEVSDPYINLVKGPADNKEVESAIRLIGGSNIAVSTLDGAIIIDNTYTPVHHQAKNIVGGSATAKANAQVTGIDGVYLNLVENDTVRSSHKIVGAKTANGVSKIQANSDSNGNITLDMGIASTSEMAGAISAWEAAEATTPGSGDAAAETYVAQVEAA